MANPIPENQIEDRSDAIKIAARVAGAALTDELGQNLPSDEEVVTLAFKKIGEGYLMEGLASFHARRVLRGWDEPPQETTSPTRG